MEALPAHLALRITPVTGTRPLRSGAPFVLYWLRTAQRAHENPALDVALHVANGLGVPVLVYHGVSERYPFASDRHHRFILEGVRDVAREFAARDILHRVHVERQGHRGPHLVTLARQAALVVTEDLPVGFLERWTGRIADVAGETALWAVDTACLVPARIVPAGATHLAYRFRSVTAAARSAELERPGWPEVQPTVAPASTDLPFEPVDLDTADLDALIATCAIDHAVGPVPHTPGGSAAGYARWERFRDHRLALYHRTRNDPLRDGVSRMSAYLHYGMVSPFRLAREAHRVGGDGARKYLDELLVWRELAHAFCRHHPQRDTVAVLPDWARATLAEHEGDPRPLLPSAETLARGRTGDPLWDAAQRSLLVHGELHNNVRMTWGKALPGWTRTVDEALERLLELNHRYALDGRDPSSSGGILWCLGQFDRPFRPEIPILGTVRPRPTADHARRLDVARYATRTARPAHPRPPRVAVVGSGAAGLICARTLADHGLPVTVFEKARRPGGRLATRESRATPDRTWDHGAAFLTARDPWFSRLVRSWEQDRVVAPWGGRIVHIAGGTVAPAREAVRWVGVPTMRQVGAHLAQDVTVRCNERVVEVQRADREWWIHLDGGSRTGPWDVVVVALPSGQAAPLLAAAPSLASAAAAVRMAPCWAGLLQEGPDGDHPWDAAFLDHPVVTWVARQGSRPGRAGERDWVIHASPQWSTAHLEADPDDVAAALAEAFSEVTGTATAGELPVVHRWRYALPLDLTPGPCLWDRDLGVGACGDWCAGGRVEGAFLSGSALAGRILAPEGPAGPEVESMDGLDLEGALQVDLFG